MRPPRRSPAEIVLTQMEPYARLTIRSTIAAST